MKNNVIKNLDTVIISNQFWNKEYSGKIGFVIELRNDNDDNEWRFDIQLPFDYTKKSLEKNSQIFNQVNCGINDITLLQQY